MSKTTRKTCKMSKCMKRSGLDEEGYCPRCKVLVEAGNTIFVYECKRCTKEVKDGQCAVLCEYCDEWLHIECAEVSKEEYDILQKSKHYRFFCDSCDANVDEALTKHASLTIQTKSLQDDMKTVKKDIESIQNTIKRTVREEITGAIEEKQEIEQRKMNLIVFNLPEPEKNPSDTAWDREAKEQKDIELLTKIFKEDLQIPISPRNGITVARRLGLQDKDKVRPLKIEFSDLSIKRSVLGAAKKLRQSTDPISKKLYINPDLTQKQKEIDRELREEMWRRRDNNENVIIRRGQIVTVEREVNKTRPQPKTRTPTTTGHSSGTKPNSAK